MFTFLSNNAGTIITVLVLLVIVTVIIAKIVRDKRKGKCTGCPCGCDQSSSSCNTRG